MLDDETAGHLSASVARYLSEAWRLARILQDEHRHGVGLCRELERTDRPPEDPDPAGEVGLVPRRTRQAARPRRSADLALNAREQVGEPGWPLHRELSRTRSSPGVRRSQS